MDIDDSKAEEAAKKIKRRRKEKVAENVIEAYNDGDDYVDVLTDTRPFNRLNREIRKTNAEEPDYPEYYEVTRYFVHELTAEDAERIREKLEDGD